jgi:nucleoside-diphosphate-sugar epimerase
MSVQPKRKALLTGATGFIGGHLTRELLRAGWELHLIVLPGMGLGTIENLHAELQIYPHDGTTEQLLVLFDQIKPDVVFHLASLFLAQHTPADIEQLVKSNVLFATQLAEAMTRAGCFRLVNTGTSWEHYENGTYNPVNLYAASKQAFEIMLEYYLATTPLKAVTLKLFDTYGPDDPRPKLFTLLQKVAAEGEPLAMSPGEQLIDLVYIDDIVRAFVMAADRLLENRVGGHERYAVSSGNPLSLRELVEFYGRVIGRTLLIEWGARPYRTREVMVPWSTGELLPGWRPIVCLEEGMKNICSSGSDLLL